MTIGPEFVKEDFAGVFSGEFSEPVTVHLGGSDYDMTAVYDDTFLEANDSGSIVNSDFSRVTFDENTFLDVTGQSPSDTEVSGIKFTIRGSVFSCYTIERDGMGLVLFNLKKQ